MADKSPDPAESSEPSAPSNAELDAKVSALDAKLDTILDKLGGGGGEGAAAEPKQPASVADEIRQQLAERDRQAQADAARTADGEWRKSVDERITGLAEKTPEPPVRRVEKAMWGRR